jgi:protein-S-isoprenylcysteine O-methyltransferase Ste14
MDTILRLPRSMAGWFDPLVVCAVIIAAYGALSPLPISNLVLAALIVAVLVLVMGLLEWLRTPKVTEPYPAKAALRHGAVAWAGSIVGFAMLLLIWDTLAEYYRSYYAPFFDILPWVLAAGLPLAALFIWLGMRARGPSTSGDYQLGLLALGRVAEVDWRALRDAVIIWLIRGFFLPINFVEIVWTLGSFRGHVHEALFGGPWVVGEYYLLIMLYGIIVAAVTPGYLFSSRLIRTETKAVSHSWFAWAVTLGCYTPFVGAFFGAWFDYAPGSANPKWFTPWVAHLSAAPLALAVVGAGILLLTLIHLWGETIFNLRSSNMANRGVITNGPYRFTKHPVYVSKCLAWLLIWMPFASGLSLIDDLRLTVLWFGVCVIYGLRALAEEQLLASDRDYVAYGLWMDEHGLFKKVGRWFPAFSFKWRLAYWRARPLPEQVIAESA